MRNTVEVMKRWRIHYASTWREVLPHWIYIVWKEDRSWLNITCQRLVRSMRMIGMNPQVEAMACEAAYHLNLSVRRLIVPYEVDTQYLVHLFDNGKHTDGKRMSDFGFHVVRACISRQEFRDLRNTYFSHIQLVDGTSRRIVPARVLAANIFHFMGANQEAFLDQVRSFAPIVQNVCEYLGTRFPAAVDFTKKYALECDTHFENLVNSS